MQLKTVKIALASVIASSLVFSVGIASATAMTASCSGVPAGASVTWSATSTGGIAPIQYSWNGASTSTATTFMNSFTVSGTYPMVLVAVDASSTSATSTCSATVSVPVATTTPTIGSTLQDQINALIAEIALLKAQILALITQRAAHGHGVGVGTTTPGIIGHNKNKGHDDNGACVATSTIDVASSTIGRHCENENENKNDDNGHASSTPRTMSQKHGGRQGNGATTGTTGTTTNNGKHGGRGSSGGLDNGGHGNSNDN